MLTDALLIFGAGGHGRVVADAARAAGATGLLASDRNPALCQGELLPGILLHRPDAPAPAQATALHVAISGDGDPGAVSAAAAALRDALEAAR